MKPQPTCTNASQSKKLIELGLREDTADLYITNGTISNKQTKDAVPSWSLAKMVEIVTHYPTPHPEIWHDVDFFTEIYNELCHALVNGYCWDYWSDEKRQQEKDPDRNHWSKAADAVRKKLPKVFQSKWPDRQQLIDFFKSEGSHIKHRDDRIGKIYRTAAEELQAYDDMLKKPRLMLQWSRNTFGYHHLSAWALNDKGEGCYEYAVSVGINKLSALLRLARQMKRMGYLHLLRYVVKQETVSDIPGRVKHFRIEQVTDTYFLIRQRHTLLFFFHFYDSGAELLCPDYRRSSRLDAMDFISKTAREKGFDYRIHEKR